MAKIFDAKLFKKDGELFIERLMAELRFIGLPINQTKADHLCFRVETTAQYEFYKNSLSLEGRLLVEANVNGRPISTFKLTTPFEAADQVIDIVELPFPKPGTHYPLGFEHAEFVIQEDFKSFSARYPHLDFFESGHKNINPELILKTKSGVAKFHYLTLERVIEIEQAKFKDIIFDFDGTIIQSRDAIYEINRRVFSEVLDRPVSLEEAKEKFHSEFTKLFEAFGLNCPHKAKLASVRWSEISEEFTYKLFERIEGLLFKLHDLGCRLHLWTARDEASARLVLNHHNLEKVFTTMSFSTEIDSKPHSKSLTFDWKSAEKNSYIVIGDSPTDIVGSINTGAVAAAALWDPAAHHPSLIASGAELHFYSVQELDAWLTNKLDGTNA